jgi:hypothetical protein
MPINSLLVLGLYANPQLTREVMISLSTSILSDLNRKKETENLSIQAIQ